MSDTTSPCQQWIAGMGSFLFYPEVTHMPTPGSDGYVRILLTDWVWPKPEGWSDHPLGVNYFAKIEKNSNAPGGVKRHWLPKGKGIIGIVVRTLAAGDPFEFGSSNTDKQGTVTKHRAYGVVVEVNKTQLIYKPTRTADEALSISEQDIVTLPDAGATPFIMRQIRAIDMQIAELQTNRAELVSQINNRSNHELVDLPDMAPDQSQEPAGVVSATPAPKSPSLPLHKLMGPPPSSDDDDEEEWTPEQEAALKKITGKS